MSEKNIQSIEKVFDDSLKKITDYPHKAGEYCITIEGVMFCSAQYLDFDGKEWVNLDSCLSMASGDISKISYFNSEPQVYAFNISVPKNTLHRKI
jgi:hypothetical protein